MFVDVRDEDGTIVWEHGTDACQRMGITCTTYVRDGTIQQVIEALELALSQARGELRVFDDSNRVLDRGSATGKV